jgi:hypothetical protein
LERLSARAQRPEAGQEVLIAPGERWGPLATAGFIEGEARRPSMWFRSSCRGFRGVTALWRQPLLFPLP